jgi:hypothetical protein
MVKLTTTNIVGSADSTCWSQAQSSAMDDGRQLLVFAVKCSDDSLVTWRPWDLYFRGIS